MAAMRVLRVFAPCIRGFQHKRLPTEMPSPTSSRTRAFLSQAGFPASHRLRRQVRGQRAGRPLVRCHQRYHRHDNRARVGAATARQPDQRAVRLCVRVLRDRQQRRRRRAVQRCVQRRAGESLAVRADRRQRDVSGERSHRREFHSFVRPGRPAHRTVYCGVPAVRGHDAGVRGDGRRCAVDLGAGRGDAASECVRPRGRRPVRVLRDRQQRRGRQCVQCRVGGHDRRDVEARCRHSGRARSHLEERGLWCVVDRGVCSPGVVEFDRVVLRRVEARCRHIRRSHLEEHGLWCFVDGGVLRSSSILAFDRVVVRRVEARRRHNP
jgi:hypothetical protein